MLEFRPYRTGHLKYLRPQEAQKFDHLALMLPEHNETLEGGPAMSAWDGHRCVAVAGVVPITPYRAMGWTVLSNDASPYMLQIVRKSRRALAQLPYKRIEIAVQDGFEQGHTLARLLGMKLETPEPLRHHGVRGEDEYMYALVK